MKKLIMPLLAITWSYSAQAQTIEHDHQLRTTHAFEDKWVQNDIVLDSQFFSELSENITVTADSRLYFDHQQRIESDPKPIELRQLYIQGFNNAYSWQLGKQYHNWSEMDGLTAFAMVSPRSFQQFILQDFEQTARGLPMVNLAYDGSNQYWQVLLGWDIQGHQLPEINELFGFRAKRFNFGFDLNPNEPRPWQYIRQSYNPLFAARYKQYRDGWEWGVQYRVGPDFEPVGEFQTSDQWLSLQQSFAERHTYTLHANTQVDSTVWRAQISYSPDRTFNTLAGGLDLRTEKANQLVTAVGLDWQAPLDLFINVQVMVDTILDTPENLIRPQTDVVNSILARRSFANETWHAQTRWYSSNEGDGLIRTLLTHNYSDSLDISLGADYFYGDSQGLFGQYDPRDRVFIELKVHF